MYSHFSCLLLIIQINLIQCGTLHKALKTRRWGSLGTVLETIYHTTTEEFRLGTVRSALLRHTLAEASQMKIQLHEGGI